MRSGWCCCWPHLVLLRTLVSSPETHFKALQVVDSNCVFLVVERQYFQKNLGVDLIPLLFGCHNMTRFQALHVVDYNQVIQGRHIFSYLGVEDDLISFTYWRLLHFPCHNMRWIWNKMLSPLHCICVTSIFRCASIS